MARKFIFVEYRNDNGIISREANGFEKIELLGPGVSPLSEIDRRDREYQKQMGL